MLILHHYAELSAYEASKTSGTSREIYHQILGLMRPRFPDLLVHFVRSVGYQSVRASQSDGKHQLPNVVRLVLGHIAA